MKKLLLIIALLFSVSRLNAQNVGDEAIVEYDGYSLKFTVTSVEPNECKVKGNSGPKSYMDITIPTKVEIEGNEFIVTTIETYAFNGAGAHTITGVLFEEDCQLKTIEGRAFEYCVALTDIIIPKSVNKIEPCAFCECNSLTSIIIEEGNTVYDSRNGCNAIIRTAWNALIAGCKNTIIPNTVTEISSYAFSRCYTLKNIDLPNSIVTIQSSAFEDCDSLTSIKIPKYVTYISSGAFAGCSGLTSIIVEEGNSSYDSRENCNAIINTENNELILGCQNTIMPNTVTSIGYCAFDGCSSLTNIAIPNGVTFIGPYAFADCKELANIEIPNGVTYIGQYAFFECSSLRNIELPSTVTYIGNRAFWWSSLLSIRCLADSVPELGYDRVFFECPSSMQIQVPENSIELYKSSEQWNDFAITKIYPYHNGDYVIKEYDGYSLKFSANPLLEACEIVCEVKPESQSKITIPSKVAFGDLELDVVSIKDAAFYGCVTLITIEIPDVINSIGNYCFEACYNLSNVLCYADNVPEAGDEIFYQCPSDMKIYVPENSVDDYMATTPWNEYTILSLNAAPENLTATAIDEYSIKLQWDDCLAHSYNIYSADTLVANVTETSFVVKDLNYYTDYCFIIAAIRDSIETEHSAEVCAKTHDLPITTPINIVTSAESTSEISLSWDAVENALSYNIYRGNELIGQLSADNGQQTLSYLVENLEYNTEYCFSVTAVRNETETEKSEKACAKTLGEGIEEMTSSFEIYPNLVSDELYIDTDADTDFEVEIYNVKGQRINKTTRLQVCEQQSIDVSNLNSGVYIVRIKLGSDEVVKRIIKR